MNKKITVTYEVNIHLEPLPVWLQGLRAPFGPSSYAFPRDVSEHGCLDAPIDIPAGSCYFTTTVDGFRYVFQSSYLRR